MRYMTYIRSYPVVFNRRIYDRYRSQISDKCGEFLSLARQNSICWRDEVIGVLYEPVGCRFVAGSLRADHRMSADKISGKFKLLDCFVYVELYAANISQYSAVCKKRLELTQIFYVIVDRCAQKDIVTPSYSMYVICIFSQRSIGDSFLESGYIVVKADYSVIRENAVDGFGNRSSDKSQTDKSY